MKLRFMQGHDQIKDPNRDITGVGWILAKRWYPYQRPNFVTPPFAGYVSGHSTYSRAGAQVLTLLTGDEFFPGGMGEFLARKNQFLVFEEGPTTDIHLQWAKYFDAADQCSLSRIWGGIHPPFDDLPGRRMGATVAREAFSEAKNYFQGVVVAIEKTSDGTVKTFPIPSSGIVTVTGITNNWISEAKIVDLLGRSSELSDHYSEYSQNQVVLDLSSFQSGMYFLVSPGNKSIRIILERK